MSFSEKIKKMFGSRASRLGSYSVGSALIVLVILIVVNVAVAALPATWTQIDISSFRLFSFSDETKRMMKDLEKDVSLYWLVREGNEEKTVETLLDRYSSLSSHIKVKKIDPDANPAFVSQYASGTVYDNSLAVVCGERSRFITYSSYIGGEPALYLYDLDAYQTTGEISISFAGESAVTSGINFVLKEKSIRAYGLTGHGESPLSENYTKAVSQDCIEYSELSLISEGRIPEDADVLLLLNPVHDIATEELNMIVEWCSNGGALMLVTADFDPDSFLNTAFLMAEYGIVFEKGSIMETSARKYFRYPMYILPDIENHPITKVLRAGGYSVILPWAQGMTLDPDEGSEDVELYPLLSSSAASFSKVVIGDETTFEQEDGDPDGPFYTGFAVEDKQYNKYHRMVIFTCPYLLDDSANELVSGGNQTLFLKSLGWLGGEDEEELAISATLLDYKYLTMTDATASMLKIIFMIAIPAIYLLYGVIVVIQRRRH